MKIPSKIKLNGEEVEIFVSSDLSVTTVPKELCLEDSIEEMINDIGEFDINYLQEVYDDNSTMTIC